MVRPDVLRLNYDGGGFIWANFRVMTGCWLSIKTETSTCNFDLSNHFEPNFVRIEKYDDSKVGLQPFSMPIVGYAYLKRFTFDATDKVANFLGENPNSKLFLLTDTVFPRVEAIFGGGDDFRNPIEIEVEEFIGVKSFKAKGKRISNTK